MTPIELARAAWLGGDALRRRRLRFKRYTFGDQWGDMVLTNTDETMSELELLRRTGHHPTTCNMILPAVTAIVGHYRQKVLEKLTMPQKQHRQPCPDSKRIVRLCRSF